MSGAALRALREVGWRLGVEFGAMVRHGGTDSALQYGFGELALDEIVSFTYIG
ncbi:MAG: hypothetical protein CM15mP120_30580 [Pseudomonadota bacterium]|nr:MAG: hypothetical protein CM15mP120_30580 [Pseudomonadota bacterium]